MSDTTQSGNKREYKTAKFREGRLKLSTSCVECHRRKQKCDQKQPCRHCSRRFPQPPCIYRRPPPKHDEAPAAKDSTGTLKTHVSEEADVVAPELSRVLSKRSNGSSSASSHGPRTPDSLPNVKEEEPEEACGKLESLEHFDASSYQSLLSSMVSRISKVVLPDSADDNNSFLYHSTVASTSWVRSGSLAESRRRALAQQRLHEENSQVASLSRSLGTDSVDPLHFLGIVPNLQTAELMTAFVKIISKYVYSIDGNAGSNYYNDIWVPWAMKSPLLAYFAIFTAACYQAEAQKIPPGKSAQVAGYKVKIISLLNEMLTTPETSTCFEAISAVVYLTTNEWYWSNYQNVQAHMRGLREMVRLRGGIGDLGMNGFLRQMIILCDYYIAASYGIDISFPHNMPSPIYCPPNINTPLIYSQVYFASITQPLQIGKETAMILDDMRFLTMAVIKQSLQQPTSQEALKLSTTSSWIQDRILALPDGNESTAPLAHDHIYKSCRIAALIYCRAIVDRIPMSQACTMKDLNQLWIHMWRITLTRWKQIPGIFLWIILSATQAAQDTAHGRFLKSMLKAAGSYLSLKHFDVADGALMSYIRLQRWLSAEAVPDEGVKKEVPVPMEFIHNYKN